MEGVKSIVISLVVFGCLIYARLIHAGGNETNVGGGECVTHEDCSFNGLCEDEGKEIKKCYCNVRFTGQNCEANATETQTGKIIKPTKNSKSTVQVTGLEEETGKARHHVHHRWNTDVEARKRRTLEYDPGSNVAGINPASFVDAQNVPRPQPFLIYSPKSKKYLFMSKDKKILGKRNTYLEARSNRDGDRNKFILEPAAQHAPPQYYIKNVQTNKYLYVSNSKKGFVGITSNNVLGSTEDPNDEGMDADRREKFKFEFEEADDGFYRIKGNGDKYLFVSHDRHWVPTFRPNRVIEADTRNRRQAQTQLFQFTLYEKAEIRITYPDGRRDDVASGTIIGMEERITNRGTEPLVSHQTFEKLFESILIFSKTKGFSVTADLTAVIPVVGTTVQFDASFTDTKSQKVMNKFVHTYDVTTPAGRTSIIEVLLDYHYFSVGFQLTATTKEGNVLIATGNVEGNLHTNVRASVRERNVRDYDK